MFRNPKELDLRRVKQWINTDLTKYIKEYASLVGDNHKRRAIAVNTAIQNAENIGDIKKILQNQLNLLEGKPAGENINYLLDEKYSTKMSNPSTLHREASPAINLRSKNPQDPTSYHDFIKKHHQLLVEMDKNMQLSNVMRQFGK